MSLTEHEFALAKARMQARRAAGHALCARYDARACCLVIGLNNGVQMSVPVSLIQGLERATPAQLADIVISPSGLGLFWPCLDVDVYLPALLQGVLGTQSWMARQLGARGGAARSPAKALAARENGRKGGRPRKVAMQ